MERERERGREMKRTKEQKCLANKMDVFSS